MPIDGHVCGLGRVKHREFAMASGEMSRSEFTGFPDDHASGTSRASASTAPSPTCAWTGGISARSWRPAAASKRAQESVRLGQDQWRHGLALPLQHELVFVFKVGTGPHINNVELGRHGRYRTNVWTYAGINTFGASRDAELAMHPSYSNELAGKHARDCRAVMQAPWYQRTFPTTRLDASKTAETEFMTTQRGFRLATSTGGTLTGRGGEILIIDDPMKPADAQSEARRLDVQQWYSNTLLSRLDDKANGSIVLVMQRLHVDDLAGYLLEQGGWEVLSLPAIAEVEQEAALGRGHMHRRSIDEVLHPAREPREVLDQLKSEMGTADFSAQYQQAPVPAGGNMIKWEWFGFYSQLPRPGDGDIIIQSWDTASTTSELASYSVGITARIDKSGTVWLLDLVRGRWKFPDVQRKIIEAAHCHRPKCILIEDQASGIGLQQTLKRQGLSVIAIKPKGDKVMRMHAHTASLEAAKVFLPEGAAWLDEFRSEVLAFPNGKHDDQVDALSQLMTWHEERSRRTYSIRPMWPQ